MAFQTGLRASKRFRDTTRLNADLSVGYAFARKDILAEATVNYGYIPEKQARISLSGGYTSKDFNRESGVTAFDNMIWTLFAHENYVNYYNDAYLALVHRIEPANGFTVAVALSYHARTQLHNNSDYSVFYRDRKFKPNVPDNAYATENPTRVADGRHAILQIAMAYTPQMRYVKRRRSKYNVGSPWPTFELRWKKGVPGVFRSTSNFDWLQASVNQTIDLGVMSSFEYGVTAGRFPNTADIHFADLKHFGSMPFFGSFSSYSSNFGLIPVYSSSESKSYLAVDATYATPFLLLKYLPMLDNTMIRESIRLSFVVASKTPAYSELSYGLKNIFLMGELGVFVGFDKLQYRSVGFKAAFNLTRR